MTPSTNLLPNKLKEYISNQKTYNPRDNEVWRYILRVSEGFLNEDAHHDYKKARKFLGISNEEIPRINNVTKILKKGG